MQAADKSAQREGQAHEAAAREAAQARDELAKRSRALEGAHEQARRLEAKAKVRS